MRALLPALAAACLAAAPAAAHPHVWIDASLEVQTDDAGRVSALSMEWLFDDIYSLYTVEGLDADGDGRFSTDELRPMAEQSIQNLEEWRYFLDARHRGERLDLAKVEEYGAAFEDDRLTLRMTVPLSAPIAASAEHPLELRIYDPSFYIDISLAKDAKIAFSPTGHCSAQVAAAPGMDEAALMSEELFSQEVEPGSEGVGAAFADTITITCGEAS